MNFFLNSPLSSAKRKAAIMHFKNRGLDAFALMTSQP